MNNDTKDGNNRGGPERPGDGEPHGDRRQRTIAWFDSPDEVRHVELDLERHGIDAVHISTPAGQASQRRNDIDEATGKWFAGRAAIGLIIGVVAGAVIGLVVSIPFVDSFGDATLFALGGAIFGATVGFFYGFAVNLPNNPEVFDTFGADEADATAHWIAVTGSAEARERASQVMAGHNPRKLTES